MIGDQGTEQVASAATVRQIVEMARRRLSLQQWDYVSGGAGEERTLRRNRAVLEQFAFRPRLLRGVTAPDPATTIMGLPLRLPLFLAPVGGIAEFHPDGTVACARAAHAAGALPFVSILAVPTFEDVAKATDGPQVLQLYVRGDRSWTGAVLDRARDAGCSALCVTGDTPVQGRHERVLASGFRSRAKQLDPGLVGSRSRERYQGGLTWRELAWIRERWDGPLLLKGVTHPEDAKFAVAEGVDVVYVSNHGGRQLDGSAATIEVLSDIVDAVDDEAEVVIDGGFMNGPDVLKAVALGARAVGLGKLQCWALAAGGQQGVERALALLREEITNAMCLLGVEHLEELDGEAFLIRPSVSVHQAPVNTQEADRACHEVEV